MVEQEDRDDDLLLLREAEQASEAPVYHSNKCNTSPSRPDADAPLPHQHVEEGTDALWQPFPVVAEVIQSPFQLSV